MRCTAEARESWRCHQIFGRALNRHRGSWNRHCRELAETVATRLREYEELGIETFILSGYPHLEKTLYRVAEMLFPLLPISEETETPRPLRPIHAQVIPGGW